MKLKRRDFLKYSMGGMATIFVGSRITGLLGNTALAQEAQTLDITITDALKDMATHNAINNARCYFWIYKISAGGVGVSAECPGPIIIAAKGDTVDINIKNDLDEDHAFFIPGIPGADSGPIAPGATKTVTIDTANASSGAHLYYDNLNEPVNRVMGLHGALIVMPDTSVPLPDGHNFTPYDPADVTPAVQKLYDDFGGSDHFPGLAWEGEDPTPWVHDNTHVNCPPFRQYIWLDHQASPRLFAEVGDFTPGLDYPAQQFMKAFLRDPFQPHAFHTDNPGGNRVPQYFTINGQSGFFSHFSPNVTMMGRVGEPCVVHILNAGLWTHSMHLHANHMYITRVNGVVQKNPIWVDVFNVDPMDRVDYTVPYMRPPDIPNVRGIGLPDTPLTSLSGKPVWPPVEEFDLYIPPLGTKGNAPPNDPLGRTQVELGQRLSPLCYPMHDHSEPSQTSQGGNYNTGLISGIYFTGDRNGVMDFPMDEDFHMAYQNYRGMNNGKGRATVLAAPPIGHPEGV